jgi:hypothetical protein
MRRNTKHSKDECSSYDGVHEIVENVPESQIVPTHVVDLDDLIVDVTDSEQVEDDFKGVDAFSGGCVGVDDDGKHNQVNDTQNNLQHVLVNWGLDSGRIKMSSDRLGRNAFVQNIGMGVS